MLHPSTGADPWIAVVQPPLSPPPVTLAPAPVNLADEPAPPQIVPAPPQFDPPATPEPVTVLPAPTPAPEPPVAPAAFAAHVALSLHRVIVRLTTGELIEVAAHEDEAAARSEATALMRYLRDERGDWPFLAGRFVRPETIVSIDVDATP
jgi:hypothetical protein